LVEQKRCTSRKARKYGLFSCFLTGNFKVKTVDAFSRF